MLSAGIPKPRLTLWIMLAVSIVSWLSIAWGALEMAATGVETTRTALMIGLAILPAIIGPLMVLNVWWVIRLVSALQRGERVIGRWRVSVAELDAFRVEDKERSSHGLAYLNDWSPPRTSPPEGIEIVFGENGVYAHDTYFTLTKAGFYTFGNVGILPHSPLSIEFVTASTYVSNISSVIIRRTSSVLRLPITRADCSEARRVLDHYRRPETGTIAANPDFYPSRMRFGLIAAPILLLFAGAGYFLERQATGYGILPTLMMILGGVFGLGAMVLAFAAWLIGRAKCRRN